MSYPYGMKGAPLAGNGLGGLPRRADRAGISARGEFVVVGAYNSYGHSLAYLTVTEGVDEIAILGVASGESGGSVGGADRRAVAGSGGNLRYLNGVKVNAGDNLVIYAGNGAPGATSFSSPGPSHRSYVLLNGVEIFGTDWSLSLVDGGGDGGAGGTYDTGLSLPCASGGGGAGGYVGNGGDGGESFSGADGGDGLGGGAGGGAATSYSGTSVTGGDGGGVGLYGIGENGAGGQYVSDSGTNGEDGGDGSAAETAPYGVFGAGGGGETHDSSGQPGGRGAVRIIWGKGRAFPSGDVGPS